MFSVIPHVVNVYLLMINLTLVIYVNSINFGKQTEHLQVATVLELPSSAC